MRAKKIYRDLVASSPYQPATNYWRAVELDAVLQHGLPAGRGLDLGCGDGKLTQVLEQGLSGEAGRSWVGIDPDPEEASLAERVGLYEAVHVCGGDGIPEKDASFDFAFSNSVLEHIPGIEPVVAEVARLVRSSGRFIFTVPASSFHECLGGPILGKTSEEYLREVDRRCAHERYWSLAQWRECLDRHGFDVFAHVEYLDRRQARRWEILSNMTGGLLYRLHGGKARPIEIQRSLRMRRAGTGIIDRLAARLSHAALLGADPAAQTGDAKHACLLVDAIRR